MTAPYDGTVDLYRLPAGMLSRIDVSKSASSLLLGGNTLGRRSILSPDSHRNHSRCTSMSTPSGTVI